jgi:hypothetical protein
MVTIFGVVGGTKFMLLHDIIGAEFTGTTSCVAGGTKFTLWTFCCSNSMREFQVLVIYCIVGRAKSIAPRSCRSKDEVMRMRFK